MNDQERIAKLRAKLKMFAEDESGDVPTWVRDEAIWTLEHDDRIERIIAEDMAAEYQGE